MLYLETYVVIAVVVGVVLRLIAFLMPSPRSRPQAAAAPKAPLGRTFQIDR